MDILKILFYVAIAIVGTLVVAACVRVVWRAIGAYKINRAGPRRFRQFENRAAGPSARRRKSFVSFALIAVSP